MREENFREGATGFKYYKKNKKNKKQWEHEFKKKISWK